jgi:trk system potassium uptake protein TrkA
MDAVILAIGNNIEVSVLTSVILKKLGISNIHAKVDSKVHARILRLLGIQNIIFPEEQIGNQLANSLLSSNILEYIDLSSGHVIIDMVVPEEWVDKTLQELALPTKKGVNVVAIKYKSETVTEEGDNKVENRINDMPGANDKVHEGDILVLIGPKNRVNSLISETEGKE